MMRFTLDTGRLRLLRESDQRRLHALLASTLGDGTAPQQGMRLARRSGRSDYLLCAARLSTETMLLTIIDPESSAVIEPELLQQVFGLTSTQARVAQHFAGGERIAEAAAALGIQLATARAHLTAIYRKTSTNNPAQLARVLLMLSCTLDYTILIKSKLAVEQISKSS